MGGLRKGSWQVNFRLEYGSFRFVVTDVVRWSFPVSFFILLLFLGQAQACSIGHVLTLSWWLQVRVWLWLFVVSLGREGGRQIFWAGSLQDHVAPWFILEKKTASPSASSATHAYFRQWNALTGSAPHPLTREKEGQVCIVAAPFGVSKVLPPAPQRALMMTL